MKNYLVLLVFIAFFSCKSNKKVTETPISSSAVEGKPARTDADFLKKIEAKSFTPDWFSGKGSINAAMGDNGIDVDATIVIKKDSAILLIVKKFGFEGARALITPDSVFIINRLEQNYDKLPLSYLAQKFNLPPQFDAIQQLFFGNPAKLNPTEAFSVQLQDTTILLNSEQGTIGAAYAFAKKNLQLQTAFFQDESSASKMTMTFANYKIAPLQKEFAYQRAVNFFSPQSGNGEITIDFSDVEFNVAKTIRFQIPAHYKRKNYLK